MIEPVSREPLPTRIKILYGTGSLAFGIKDNGFSVFLLFYYNQVVGVRADLVSLAIAIALVVDAFFDPLIGQLTDRTRTKIGRRHPWLYASALPIAVSWLLLWHPPEASAGVQFAYLLTMAIFVRISLSLNEVPTLALLPELSRDYHDRTSITRYRYLFGWVGGLGIMFLAYAVLLLPTTDQPNGMLNGRGYSRYAIIGAIVMAIAVFVAAAATHRRIVAGYHASNLAPAQSTDLRATLSTMAFRPFLLLMLAGVFAFANQGVVFALSPYLLAHVWRFDSNEFSIYAACLLIAAVIAFLIVNMLSRRLGKRNGAALSTLAAMIFGTVPYWLLMAGMFPAPDTPGQYALLVGLFILSTAGSICAMILTTSMMADVTDAYEFATGSRAEGVFSSGVWFMQKTVGALGILMAGWIISAVGLPEGAQPGAVDPAVIDRLVVTFSSLTALIAVIGAGVYRLFPLGEADHEARVRALALRETMPAE